MLVMRGYDVIGRDIAQADAGTSDDIVSSKATRALACSLLVGSLIWTGALFFLLV